MDHGWLDQHKQLITELTQGRDLAKQLQIHLNAPSSSHETRELLIHKILNSYNKLLSLLTCSTSGNGANETNNGAEMGTGRLESQRSYSTGSPRSEDSDLEFKDLDHKDSPRKRKSSGSMQKWKQQVRVSPETGVEGPLDDGYSWRKYGQKDILGAKYPRGYYRCSYRLVQGCFATKQVQRSDDDPNLFDITYRGTHTCNPNSEPAPPPPLPLPEIQEPPIPQPPQNQLLQSPEILFNFQTGLKVLTENMDNPTYHFPSAASDIKTENHIFPPSAMLDNNFQGNMSSSFVSPATSASNYFSMSPPHMSGFGENPSILGAAESELIDGIVSTAAVTSSTTSSTVGLGFPFGDFGFDQSFNQF